MEEIKNFFSTPYAYMIIIFVIVAIVYTIFLIKYNKKKKAEEEKYLEEHKDIAKVYVSGSMDYVQIFVKQVDGTTPHDFQNGMKRGFYLEAGNHEIVLNATWTRPGVMYKTVTTSTDDIKISFDCEKNKEYQIIYDKKNKEFKIDEITIKN